MCNLGTSCTTVSCCIPLDSLKTSFNTWVDVDTCNYKLRFGIEKLQQEVNLYDYEWGKFYSLLCYIFLDFFFEKGKLFKCQSFVQNERGLALNFQRVQMKYSNIL